MVSEHACKDSISLPIKIENFFQIYFPDAFSPGNDFSNNNYFYPKGIGASETNFQMIIFDRWGESIFTSSEFPQGFSQEKQVEGGWNGRYNNSGDYVPNGIYIWRIQITDKSMVMHEFTGTVNLIR